MRRCAGAHNERAGLEGRHGQIWRSALAWTVAGLSVPDLATAALLSVGAVSLASGVIHVSHALDGLGASLGVLAMTAPVAIRRRFALTAAGILAAGAVANGLAWGPLVRCGGAPPAIFLVAYSAGARLGRATLKVRPGGDVMTTQVNSQTERQVLPDAPNTETSPTAIKNGLVHAIERRFRRGRR